jgi:type I restriction enzyme R subunit
MKAHTLMQAIARANRRYPGKDFGLIIDYNGMLKSLRHALAQYALGDEGVGEEEIVAPPAERVRALLEAIVETEAHLKTLGFDAGRLAGSQGFARISALADAVEAVYTNDDSKCRFEILARQVFVRFKALMGEPSAEVYAERHDNIEAIYKKLTERRDTADVTAVLKELHKIVNEAIRAQSPGDDQAESKLFDLSKIDLEKLRYEFAKKVKRKATAIQDVRLIVEEKLAKMLQQNPLRMDYYRRYAEIVADYNREKDRVTIEDTFAKLIELANSLDAEQRRAVEEGLSEEELALFDLLQKEDQGKAERERLKLAAKSLLDELRRLIEPLDQWTQKEQTQAEVEVFILDHVLQLLPTPPFTPEEKETAARKAYRHIWQQSASGLFPERRAA